MLVDALKKLVQFKAGCILIDALLRDGMGTAVLTGVREKRLPAKVAVISDRFRREGRGDDGGVRARGRQATDLL